MTQEYPKPDRQWFLRYVLGELSQDETERSDLRFFADDDFAAELDDLYHDIADDYSNGLVPQDEIARVRHAFFSGPYEGRQLKLIQAMQSLPQKSAAAATPAATLAASPAAGAVRRARPWFLSTPAIAATAAVLCVAIAAAVFVKSRHSSAEPPIPQATQPMASDASNSAPVQQSVAAPSPNEVAYTILLLPNVNRGDSRSKKFAIPASATKINVQMVLPPGQPGKTFDVRLGDAYGRERRSLAALPVLQLGSDRYVEFSLPAAELPAGNYFVDVLASPLPKRSVEHFSMRVAREAARPPQP